MIEARTIGDACLCLAVRRTARAVSRRYDDALRPVGLTSGQFSLLSALAGEDGLPLGSLADRLGMDRTTLNRNLQPLLAHALVGDRADDGDARRRLLALTVAGRDRLAAALPHWQAAQDDSLHRLADIRVTDLRRTLAALD